ncbi:hypothetical protein JW916_07185 [Candidatus Sumerlaeota bacterium]|nr:hypothetical protein [Candidatus Sumerlaeota bacterium]
MKNRFRIAGMAAAVVVLLSLFCYGGEPPETDTSAMSDTTASGAISPALPNIPDGSFDGKRYGAVGDGTTTDTAAIQKTIDAASAAGGGTVVLPAGTYLSGPIRLASSIRFHLDEGATLVMLPFGSYPPPTTEDEGTSVPLKKPEYYPFVAGFNLHDVALSGSGVIEGQGEPWWEKFEADQLTATRPTLVKLRHIERLSVTGVHLQDSPMFHLTISHGTDVTVDGISVTAHREAPNTDAVQLRGRNIAVKNCMLATGDDNIVFGAPTSDVSVTDCKFGVGHGVSIGSYTGRGVRNISMDRCTFENTTAGIKGKSMRGRGGVVENLRYSNITMINVKNPIEFRSYYSDKNKTPDLDEPKPMTDLTPVWRNATFTNITATTPPDRNAIFLWGVPESPIENFTFKNVKVTADKSAKIYHAKNIVFSDDSEIVTSQQEPFSFFDVTNVRTPDGEVHTVGNEIATHGEKQETKDKP